MIVGPNLSNLLSHTIWPLFAEVPDTALVQYKSRIGTMGQFSEVELRRLLSYRKEVIPQLTITRLDQSLGSNGEHLKAENGTKGYSAISSTFLIEVLVSALKYLDTAYRHQNTGCLSEVGSL
jgi:hypothetical protein